MFGLLNIHKPPGPTSHDVVARVRRLLPRKTRVGHAGTLDPFAAGVLVLGVGSATRLTEFVGRQPKQYRAEVTFGVRSTTDDSEGDLTPTGQPLPDAPAVRAALTGFVGTIDQVPPAYSAVLIDGRRAYQIARADRPVEMPVRQVRIDSAELLSMEGSRAWLRIDCGGGTYIRALARDLGERLGCGGYCSALTRTRIGAFRLEQAVPVDELREENLARHLLPARLALMDWPAVSASPEQAAELLLGRAIRWADTLPAPPDPSAPAEATPPSPPGSAPPPEVAVLAPDGELLALAHGDLATGTLRPFKVFAEGR